MQKDYYPHSVYGKRLHWWLSGKGIYLQCRRGRFDPWVTKISQGRKWQPFSVFLPGKFHGQRSLGYSLWGHRVGHDLVSKQQQQQMGK